jgi:hypothetical protein
MEEQMWGIIGSIGALLSLGIQFCKAIITIRKERTDKLSLKLCDEIAYYDGKYQIKIINDSPNATAYNLQMSLRIKNRHFNYVYRIQSVTVPVDIFSINKDNEKEMCEILVNVDAMRIIRQDIEDYASKEIKKLFEESTLGLRDLLFDRELYLAVRFNAVNKATGKTKDFPKYEFCYDDIKPGVFGVGEDHVTMLK